ncbi:MAG TPA: hypothetical protein VFZ32_03785 [Micromonosporaceae bacterium]
MTLHVIDIEGPIHRLPFTVEPSGRRVASKEVPERVERIRDGLLAGGAVPVTDPAVRPRDAERLVAAVHDWTYLKYLRTAPEPGPDDPLDDSFAAPGLRQDTPVTRGTWPAALAAAAAAASAAEFTLATGGHSYALVRPPGHHAGRAWHGGYCFVNNAVLAAHVLLAGGLRRIAILDLDYHLGNGTRDLVTGQPRVTFASVHSTNPIDFPYHFPDDAGLFGIATDPRPEDFITLVSAALAHVRAARPRALVVSLGYDVLANDPHGSWSLPVEVFAQVGALLAGQGLPVIFIQEGGYGLPSLQPAARALALEFL